MLETCDNKLLTITLVKGIIDVLLTLAAVLKREESIDFAEFASPANYICKRQPFLPHWRLKTNCSHKATYDSKNERQVHSRTQQDTTRGNQSSPPNDDWPLLYLTAVSKAFSAFVAAGQKGKGTLCIVHRLQSDTNVLSVPSAPSA